MAYIVPSPLERGKIYYAPLLHGVENKEIRMII